MSSYPAYGSISVKTRPQWEQRDSLAHSATGIDSNKPLNTDDVIKRAMDVVLSFCGLIALIPLFPIFALVIRLQSSGPVLYRSLRVGRKGRIFTCYKSERWSKMQTKNK
jgi:lipopolysaccharide/colanic/teichoic acid biosynthesis glycosyltransferase